MDEAGNYGFGTWRPESSKEGATSGGPATLHASFLETTAAGPSARVRPMVKGGGGGKAGDHGVDKGRGCGASHPLDMRRMDGHG